MNGPSGPVLLYDGYCGFCNWAVRMVLRADRAERFRFAPLDGELASAVLSRHPGLHGVDSLVLVDGTDPDSEEVYVRSGAVLRSARLLGGAWGLLAVFVVIPRPIRDWMYDALARWRYRLFGRYETCPVPPPEVRGRFLD